MEEHPIFVAAANWCAGLVAAIPQGAWGEPGLGEWDLRSLVGHTSRALTTVAQAIETPALTEDLATAEDYFIAATDLMRLHPHAVRDRGFAAGHEMGEDPHSQCVRFLKDAEDAVESAARNSDDLLVTSICGGMRLSQYLRTRVFELVVHGLDIRAALQTYDSTLSDLADPPAVPLRTALTIATNLAEHRGDGSQTLFAVTGRGSLPSGYSVLA